MSRGGGVLVAVKEGIPCSVLSSPSELEVVTLNIGSPFTFTLCTIYIPPSSPNDYHIPMIDYLKALSSTSTNLVLAGDFNYPDINWAALTGSTMSSKLCDYVFDNNLIQLVHRPTLIKGSILDILLTNNIDLIHNIVVHLPGETPIFTDHFMVSYQCRVSESGSGNCRVSTVVYDFPKAD